MGRARVEITDEKMLRSESYRLYLQDIVRALSGNYLLKVLFGKWPQTDGSTIWLLPDTKVYDGLSLARRTLCIMGNLAHEFAHVRWTDFRVWKAFLTSKHRLIKDPKLQRKIPAMAEKMMLKRIMNTIEDGFIEAAALAYYTGIFRAGIWAKNEVFFAQHPSQEDLFNNGASQLEMALSYMLEDAKYLKRKTACPDPEVEAWFWKHRPLWLRAKVESVMRDRCDIAEELFLSLEPWMNQDPGEESNDSESHMQWENGKNDSEPIDPSMQKRMEKMVKKMAKKLQQEAPEEPEESDDQEQEDDAEQSGNTPLNMGGESESEEDEDDNTAGGDNEESEDAEPAEGDTGEGETDKESDQDSGDSKSSKSSKGSSDEETEEEEDEDSDEKDGSGKESDEDQSESESESSESSSGEDQDSEENEEDENGDGSSSGDSESEQDGDESGDDDSSESSTPGNSGTEDSDGDGEGDPDDLSIEEDDEAIQQAIDQISQELDGVREDAEAREIDEIEAKERRREMEAMAVGLPLRNYHDGLNMKIVQVPQTDMTLYEQLADLQRNEIRVTSRKLKDLIRRNEDQKLSGLDRGRINQSALHRRDNRIFYQRKEKSDEKQLLVAILMDESGSMLERQEAMIKAASFFIELCDALKIPCAVYGHNAIYYTKTVNVKVYRDFDDPLYYKTSVLRIKPDHGTRDGMPLAWLEKRLSKRQEADKLLICLSDGEPHHVTRDYKIDDEYLPRRMEDTLYHLNRLKQKGTDVIGLCIGDEAKSMHALYPLAIDIPEMSALSKAFVKIVEKNLFR